MVTINEIFNDKYKKRIEDLNNNCNDETIVEIYLNISREHFNMELVHSFELKNITKNDDNILLDILQYINLNEIYSSVTVYVQINFVNVKYL